jgi:predicted DNA-binding transcriptional regulator AlpA
MAITKSIESKGNRGRKKGYKLPPPTLHPDATMVRPNQVHLVTGFSRATAYRLLKLGDFPKLIKLTSSASGWNRRELEEWLASRQTA